jgi:hypothetical protein
MQISELTRAHRAHMNYRYDVYIHKNILCTYTYIRTYIQVCICIHVCMFVCVCVCVCVCV